MKQITVHKFSFSNKAEKKKEFRSKVWKNKRKEATRLLCISIQAPSTPDPNVWHVSLLLFVLSAFPVTPQLGGEKQNLKRS
jgi:hypothetical protein